MKRSFESAQDLESEWPRPRDVLDLNRVQEGGTALGK